MKIKILLLALLLLTTQGVWAQIMFERTYGGTASDQGTCVQQTSDSGYIFVGATFSFGAGNRDIYLIKTNQHGDTLWTKTYGGAGTDLAYSVMQTIDGGYIIAGSTMSFGAGSSDVYLIKTNDMGDTLWVKTFGGAEDDEGYSVIENDDGSFVIVGVTLSFAAGFSAAYIIKTDVNGNLLWSKTYEKLNFNMAGDIRKTSGEDYIVVGSTDELIDSFYSMIYVLKINESGDTLWTKTYANLNGELSEGGFDFTSDNGFMFSGNINYPSGEADIYLMKTDTLGNFLWFKTYGGAGVQTGGNSFQTNDGGFIITGVTGDPMKGFNILDLISEHFLFDKLNNAWTNGDLYLLKTNSNGDSLWSKTYGNIGEDAGNSVQQTYDNGFIICGYTSIGSNMDFYLIKTDNTGFAYIPNNEENYNDLKLFPNPCNGIFQIQSNVCNNENAFIDVFNYSGQIILCRAIDFNVTTQIDLKTYGSGIYLIHIKGKSFNISKKIIVE